MEYKDYYKIMGIEQTASQDEIKRAYRKLARKYHPDVSKEPNAEAQFKELGEAYEILKDPKKRKQYDQYGQDQQQHQHRQSSWSQEGFQNNARASASTAPNFEDFLSSLFGQQRPDRSEYNASFTQGRDIHTQMTILLEDSYLGAEKVIQLQIPQVDTQGNLASVLRSIKVKIPPGISNKQQIRLKGQGGKGTQNEGDLYIEIHIKPHPLYHVHKKDLHIQIPITPWEAALGSSIQVPTLSGPVQLKIPKLSQSGKQMRLRGKGLPGNPPGDFFVNLQIVIPPVENEQLTALYEQMAHTTSFNPREKLGTKHD